MTNDPAATSCTTETEASWFKSSYSSQDGGNCIEIALTPRTVRVRDSKDTVRPGLAVSAQTWSAFIAHLG
jgi:hypothetical protein